MFGASYEKRGARLDFQINVFVSELYDFQSNDKKMFANTFFRVPQSLFPSHPLSMDFTIHSSIIVIHSTSFGKKHGLPFSIKRTIGIHTAVFWVVVVVTAVVTMMIGNLRKHFLLQYL